MNAVLQARQKALMIKGKRLDERYRRTSLLEAQYRKEMRELQEEIALDEIQAKLPKIEVRKGFFYFEGNVYKITGVVSIERNQKTIISGKRFCEDNDLTIVLSPKTILTSRYTYSSVKELVYKRLCEVFGIDYVPE